MTVADVFLSTLSLRRATTRRCLRLSFFPHFYPRSPCGERLRGCPASSPRRYFYPRSPCGERPYSQHVTWPSGYFYPRSPCGERLLTAYQSGLLLDFYPRSPCGERLTIMLYNTTSLIFLSTLSLRRATTSEVSERVPLAISIHALLAESDLQLKPPVQAHRQFLSTLSLRRATRLFFIVFDLFRFLSTLSLRRATC